MNLCPPREQLQRLLAEDLPPPERAPLEAHVERCVHCQQALEQLTEDSLVDASGARMPTAQTPLLGLRGKRDDRAGPEREDGSRTSDLPASAAEQPQALDFLAPATRPDALGRLGHYEVLQELGRGGFGIVFRAFDDVLQRVVAIKVLTPELAATSPARKRFLREARAAAKVRHDNVVQIHAVAEQPLPYLVMEFIPGETLQRRLDRTGPFEAAEVVAIGRQLAEGLAAAHAADLIHRDIKPGNVLVEDGPQLRVKITDFGLARAADDASLTQSGVVAGTPQFMSPEQAGGERLDHRTDLFSLGSVLYTITSGRPPFRAANTLAVLKRVVEEAPRPIPEIIPETPPWLCATIARLHEKAPDDRFQTAREVADALAEREPIPPTTGRRPARPRSRLPWLAALAAVIVSLGVGVGAFILRPDEQAGDSPAAPRSTPAKPVAPAGPRKFALAFDGNAVVNLPTLRYDGSHPMTAECWFKIARFRDDGHQNLIANGPGAGFHFGFNQSSRTWDCLIHLHNASPVAVAGGAPLVPGRLMHAALVFDGDQLELYQDGKLIVQEKLANMLQGSPKSIALGNMNGGPPGERGKGGLSKKDSKDDGKGDNGPSGEGDGFIGQLYDVRFSRSARYRGEFVPAPRLEGDDDTWALYRCDEGEGETLIDYSGNGHNGKLTGATWVKVPSVGPSSPSSVPLPGAGKDGRAGGNGEPPVLHDGATIPGWGKIIDPQGDCSIRREKGKVTMTVPGTHHDLVPTRPLTAPRVLQEVAGDFTVQVKMIAALAPGHNPLPGQQASTQSAGLLLWDNDRHLLRLESVTTERPTDKVAYSPVATLEYWRDRKSVKIRDIPVPDRRVLKDNAVYLRLTRRGDEVRTAWSKDGIEWMDHGEATVKFPQKLLVGVAALNASRTPCRVEFEDFKVAASGP